MFKIKRSYQDPDIDDGFRILVDRLWPRGLSKKNAKLDLWMKEIAPSNELRKMFGHDPEKFDTFKEKYLDELKDKKELIKQLKILEKINHKITLVYSAKDEDHNNAVVLLVLLKIPTNQVVMGVSRTHGC
jgi:uncharacterized protein YeaO (DUF488 family)